MNRAALAYAQARLQVRLAARPGPAQWQMIDIARDLAQCLDAITRTSLAPVVVAVNRLGTPHEIERALRDAWAVRIAEYASWVPPGLRPAIAWLRLLPHLRLAEARAAGATRPDWLPSDCGFSELWEDAATGDTGVLRERLDAGESVAEAWLAEFQARLGNGRHPADCDLEVDQVIKRFLGIGLMRKRPDQLLEDEMIADLSKILRRKPQTPAAMIAACCVDALDFERIRGALLVHAAFAMPGSENGAV